MNLPKRNWLIHHILTIFTQRILFGLWREGGIVLYYLSEWCPYHFVVLASSDLVKPTYMVAKLYLVIH